MTSAGSLRTPFEAALVGRLLERPPTTARLPVGVLTQAEKAAELQRLQARKAMDAAYEAELVLGLADDTPDTLDPPPHQPGAKRGSWAPEPELPADEAAEGYDLIDQLAKMLKADGDERPIGQLRAEVFSRLIRRPADSGLPGVTATVTVTAALPALEGTADTPGSVDGLPITAAHVRELLTRLGALGLRAPEGGMRPPAPEPPDPGHPSWTPPDDDPPPF